ncbi:hypothetical protein R8Z50_19355 [Longispora sp. K20-0274]|uniref:GHMP family kinase ATP-binding protein n=1 Tax=Longispora sp. K20-0274 TaxID=3088255 RepID=UPI00399A7154
MTGPTGTGTAPCHHGELLQGVFADATGHRHRALVTLPMAAPRTRAAFTRRPDAADIVVHPPDRAKARAAAALTLAACAPHGPGGGRLVLRGAVPVGLGMGSSSSDVIATIRAVAASCGRVLPAGTVARLAVRAEGASDPLMLAGGPVLFAQREGRVLEALGARLPPALVVGCLTGGGEPVDTLALPDVGCGAADLAEYARLRADLRHAVTAVDAGLLGRVATASARLNQRVLPRPELAVLLRIAARLDALGVQVAHSGSVAGLLFDPTRPDLVRRCRRALAAEGLTPTHLFHTAPDEENEDVRTHRRRHRPAGPGRHRGRPDLPAVRDHEGGVRAHGGPAPAR